MRESNSSGRIKFLLEHVFWAFIGLYWFDNTLFKCLDRRSLSESRAILLIILAASCLTGICLEMRKSRNELSVFFNIVTGLGVYTIFAYARILDTFFKVSLCIALALSLICAAIIMCRKIKNRERRGKILRSRTARAIFATRRLFGFCLALILMGSTANLLFGSALIRPAVSAATPANLEEFTIANNLDTIVLLDDDKWVSLTVQEKLDVLQTVANIEQRYFGLPNELNVGAANLADGHLGYYSDRTHEIIINTDRFLDDTSWALLRTVCHEAYHSYQHRMVDAYNGADESIRNLQIFYKATAYADEFENYISGEEDFCSYYQQHCESDARAYAEDAVSDYYLRIKAYLLQQGD